MDFSDDSPDGDALDSTVKPGAIRIILADSQAIYRVGIRKVFALEDDLRVVAQADSIENLRAAIERFPTDIVLLEGSLVGSPMNLFFASGSRCAERAIPCLRALGITRSIA